ncbi:MAG: mycothiol synthase [Acidimicrobiales bacterium]
MHEVQVKRRMGEADVAEVSELVGAVAAADGHRPLGEHKWLDLVHGGRRGFAGFVARGGGSARGPLAGYAQVSHGHRTWGVEVVVRPQWRSPEHAVTEDLLCAALAEIARQGGGHVHLWVPKPTTDWDQTAARCGLQRGRDLLQMRRELPLDDPSARVDVRPFVVGQDESAWLGVNNRAFASHPEQGNWDLDTIIERETEQWFDPDGLLLYERDGRLAASCWTKIHAQESPPVGEIYVIAVDPDFQGLGLGRALVIAGLDYLSARGLQQAMLYVDGANDTALALYRSLGFDVDHVDRAYTGDVAPSP